MCGVAGLFGVDNPMGKLIDIMTALQYRGEQGAGMSLGLASGEFFYERSLGLTSELFKGVERLPINFDEIIACIGHLRYGTAGSRKSLANTQPFYGRAPWGEFYLGHNGDTPFFQEMKEELLNQGVVFSTDSDTELLVKYIERSSQKNSIDAIGEGLRSYRGTYSLVILLKDSGGFKLVAARDPFGNRPLSIARLGSGFVVASENSAFEVVNAKYLQEVEPGAMVVFSRETKGEPTTIRFAEAKERKQCVYENIYFSFVSSRVFGMPVARFRQGLGKKLAQQYGSLVLDGDVVTNPPDSSNSLTDGFCRALGRVADRVFIRRHFRTSGFPLALRSFTQDAEDSRDEAIRKKFSIIGEIVRGKRVWLLDDSIVRGRTSKKLVSSLRHNGASWVGVLAGCPPLIGACQKGIDLNGLVAERAMIDGEFNIEEIRRIIGADFLGYLNMSDLKAAIEELREEPKNFCFGCFEGNEPLWGKW